MLSKILSILALAATFGATTMSFCHFYQPSAPKQCLDNVNDDIMDKN